MQPSTPSLFTARQIMTAEVVSVRPDTSIEEVADLLERHGISGLPVVDHEHHVVGVITEYDLLRCIATAKMRGRVADFMTAEVATVGEGATLRELVEVFVSSGVRRVPVVSGEGKLIGLIARRDLVFAGQMRQWMADLPVWTLPEPAESESGDESLIAAR